MPSGGTSTTMTFTVTTTDARSCTASPARRATCSSTATSTATPRGYAVVEVDGERLSWYYKPAGGKRDMQMRLYAPGRTNSACVYANVWGYDTAWSAVEWIPASGGQAEAMERTQRTDPYYEEVLATGVRGGTPTNTWHMFRVDPGSERGGMVRVTDSFGHTYESSVSW